MKKSAFALVLVASGLSVGLGIAFADDADTPAWRHQTEERLNGRGDDPVEFLGKMNDACGLRLRATIDWSGFRFDDWKSDMPRVGAMCLYDSASDFHDFCADEEGKKAAASLKTVTCHPRSCDKLPDPSSGKAGYRVVAGGAGYDVFYCDGGTHGDGVDALATGLTVDSPTGRIAEKEALWRHHTEDWANVRGDAKSSVSGDAHGMVKSSCGHDVSVAFDWGSMPMKDWWIPGDPNVHEETAEFSCAETVKNMARVCDVDKKPLASVTKLVCHGAPVDKLPHGRERGANSDSPIARFAMKSGELDVWFAPQTQLYPETMQKFLKVAAK